MHLPLDAEPVQPVDGDVIEPMAVPVRQGCEGHARSLTTCSASRPGPIAAGSLKGNDRQRSPSLVGPSEVGKPRLESAPGLVAVWGLRLDDLEVASFVDLEGWKDGPPHLKL